MLVDKTALKKALSVVSRVAVSRANPLLNQVRLIAQPDALTLVASGEEAIYKTTVPGDGEASFDVLVPAARLANIIGMVDSDSISFKVQKNELVLELGRAVVRFNTSNPEHFANLEPVEVPAPTLKASEFDKGLGAVTYAASDEPYRSYARGAHMVTRENHLHFVATDGYRMVTRAIEYPHEIKPVLIPKKTVPLVQSVLRLMKPDTEVRVSSQTNTMKITGDGHTLEVYLYDIEFPDYRRIIPSNYNKTLVCSREALKKALKVVGALSGNKAFFEVAENKLNLTAQSDYGESSDVVDVQLDDPTAFSLHLSIEYMLDALEHMEGDTATIKFVFEADGTCTKPIQISDGNGNTTYFTPLRV